MSKNTGKIVQVIGPVVDVAFENGELPELLSAIEIPLKDQDSLVVEAAQQDFQSIVKHQALMNSRHLQKCWKQELR